jgi:hypothetical protein
MCVYYDDEILHSFEDAFYEILDVVILQKSKYIHVILREQPFNFYGGVLVFYFYFAERKNILSRKMRP